MVFRLVCFTRRLMPRDSFLHITHRACKMYPLLFPLKKGMAFDNILESCTSEVVQSGTVRPEKTTYCLSLSHQHRPMMQPHHRAMP